MASKQICELNRGGLRIVPKVWSEIRNWQIRWLEGWIPGSRLKVEEAMST